MKSLKLFLMIALATFALNAKAQKNLVENGGFEEEDFYGWNAGSAKLTPWDVKAGKNSCAITATDASNWVGMDQSVTIPKKAVALEVGAWLKTINVVKGKDQWNGAIFNFQFLNKQDKRVGDDVSVATLAGDENWQEVKKSIKIPAGAVRLKLLIALGNASGTYLIDDVSVKVLSDEQVAKL